MLQSHVTVVTGGSRGIGAAVVAALAAGIDGPTHEILLTYRSDAAAAEAVAASCARDGVGVSAVRCDLGSAADVDALFTRVDDLGMLVGLVNNAGVLEQQSELAAITRDRWERVFAVNVFGAADCCARAVTRMATSAGGSGGSIVNVSSRAAQLGSPGEYVDYAASKAALDTLTRGLALEMAGQGVRVNGVRPGVIDTTMHATGGDPDRAARLGPSLPMGRPGAPSEVAEAVCWLLSDAASYVTGAFIDVAGGR